MQFHPHGDASIAEALVTLANRQYLIERQGNFGNILTGDPPAAARYIECRLTELARQELFNDDLTEFVPTYDGRRKEPVTLPAKLPLLLMLGADGIAVGISTRILPHNFGELLEAQIAILQKKPFEVLPDFPQGGLMDAAGLRRGAGARAGAGAHRDARIRTRSSSASSPSAPPPIRSWPRSRTPRARARSRSGASTISPPSRWRSRSSSRPSRTPDRAVEALYAFTQCQTQIASRIVVIRDNKPVELDVPGFCGTTPAGWSRYCAAN